ncbi:MAG: Hsp20/alpha crystallin family protein [Ardenticatenaceae bacterium]|nr:Hsp20/alpha crystallin family protein [Ardenticatenaceae bacterium]
MSLTRWQPFQEMMSLRETMDRLFDEALAFPLTRNGGSTVPLDIVERDNELVVHASVPGFTPEQIDISVQGDVLTLRGTKEEEQETKAENYYLRERRLDSFYRTVRLPVSINPDKAAADYENGVLTLHLPKAESAVTKKIKVQS